MPSGFATLDTNFPKLDGMSNEQRIQTLTSYLYQLLENLRYVLNNIGEENINESDWKKITNAAVFTALGQEGATVINGANISTGSINADLITTGELEGITIRGVDIYGAKYHDESGDGVLDLTSENANYNLKFGTGDLEDANCAFAIHFDPINGASEMALGDHGIMTASPWGTGVTAIDSWRFRNAVAGHDGSDLPTRTEVQAMIDASIAAAANGGA